MFCHTVKLLTPRCVPQVRGVIATKGFGTLYDAEASALAGGRPHDENGKLSVERRARGRRRRPPPQAAAAGGCMSPPLAAVHALFPVYERDV